MTVEIYVPTMGESVSEATVGKWFKQVGDPVALDELLCELETDKVTLEVNAAVPGVLRRIAAGEGATVEVGTVLGMIEEGAVAKPRPPAPAEAKAPAAAKAPEPAGEPAPVATAAPPPPSPAAAASAADVKVMPSARKLAEENAIELTRLVGSGKDGRITRADILAAIDGKRPAALAPAVAIQPALPEAPAGPRPEADREERVRMTRLRRTIARRLKDAQNTAAMLTTFNEVDMTELMAVRSEYRDLFEQQHGVRLGVMSFFVKAAIAGLKALPAVNGEIDGGDLVYKNYYHIGVAVGTPTGLVVPVLRDADQLSFAQIESKIADLGRRARDGKLAIDELQGGTFTISNGGVYGSLMSTPILNPPQSGILGMHKIQQRPMAVDGGLEARPMMYLALSYDHRIVDGREAVTFLIRVKESLEDPRRMLLDL